MPRVPQGRVILMGTVSNNQDIWTMSHAMDPLSARSQAQLDAIADAVADVFQSTVWDVAAIANLISDQTHFTGVRIDDVRDPGGVVRQATSILSTHNQGNYDGAQLPPQCAEVVSLRSGNPGASRRGRMYFPPLGVIAASPAGGLTATAQDALADAMQDYFNTFNSDVGIAGTAFIASDALQTLFAVTQIQVGSIYDTQRRRRNELTEGYESRTVTV